jgi:hypothetical protein
MQRARRNVLMLGGPGGVIAVSVGLAYALSGPRWAGVSEEAIAAAETLRKDDMNVPRDAQGGLKRYIRILEYRHRSCPPQPDWALLP